MKQILVAIIFIITLSCKSERQSEKVLKADTIINKSIEISGGEKFKNSRLTFDFRDRMYFANRNNSEFTLARITVDKNNDSIFDMLSNNGFERFINDEFIQLEDSMAVKYSASVNSVHYFSVLPFGLNDNAVSKELVGEEVIKNMTYHLIKITFNQDGGGEDYEDVFVYWVNAKTFKPDYIAYSYNEDDGIGMRFREAYNERYVTGLRFVNYNNFKAEDTSIQLYELGKAFENNQLKLLSKIELKNVKVVLIDN
ncbi:deoxyribose-phosphate aldolase [Winogradskyella sp.]|nr:deoxyribose-phosphate aldolase [Winogradskyella sp.]MDB9782721.1 deoxyribose-phosphate aldolase [Winogradskyella sp.]MDC1505764.1 deoxyribose-phosphate aldolase [Winogradskyella sp.]